MKKKRFTRKIAYPIVLGILIGLISFKYKFQPIAYIVLFIILFAILFISNVIYLTFKDVRHQKTLLRDGRYEELIKYFADKHEQLKGKMGYKEQYLVSIANCYHRMGDFQEGLNHLEKIDVNKMDNKFKASYYSLISSNLYFFKSKSK